MPDRHVAGERMRLEMTPRSAAADMAASRERLSTDALDIDARLSAESGVAFVPFLAWLVAGVSGTPSLATAAYFMVLVMLVVRPRLGYLALLPMLPFNHPEAFPPHGPMFILGGVALGSVLAWSSLGRIRLPRSVRPALWCALAFLALTTFQLFLGVPEFGGRLPFRALSQFDQIFIILSVFSVGLVVLPGRSLVPYHLAFLVSFVIVTVVAILHFIEPRALNVFALAWMVPPNAFENRASGVIANPNSLGLALACGLAWIMGNAIWQVAHRRVDRAISLVPIIPAAGLALVLTFSRAAIIAVGVGAIAALARLSVRAAGLLAVAAVLAAVLVYPLFVDIRLGQTFGQASPDGQAALAESDRLRSLMAEAAVVAFLDAPLAGHGFATFREISPTYSGQSVLTSAHDLYLKIAAEQGLIGLGLLGALLVSIVVPMWRAGPGPWIASLAVVGAFAAFSFTADTLGSAQTIAPAFFLMAAGVAQASRARATDSSQVAQARRREVGAGAD